MWTSSLGIQLNMYQRMLVEMKMAPPSYDVCFSREKLGSCKMIGFVQRCRGDGSQKTREKKRLELVAFAFVHAFHTFSVNEIHV